MNPLPMSADSSDARRLASALLLTTCLWGAACGGEGDAAPANAGATKVPAAAGGAAPGGAPAGSGRSGGSVVLSDRDIYKVATGLIEAGIPISGNLRPVETVNVRARIEGDLVALNVREGDAVRSGAVLARFESVEQEAALQSAVADLLAARTESETATWNRDQTRDLFKSGAVAERDMRAADQNALTAAARFAAAESRFKAAEAVVRDTRVLSPVTGVVEKRNVENGERVSRGATLLTVVRSDVLELTAAVPARRASALATDQVVRFSADGRVIEGRVARVSPTIDPQSQSVTVFLHVPNRNGALKGNSFATGQIIERALLDELLVPQAAIRQTAVTAGNATFVWKVVRGSLARADVKLGIVDEVRGVVQIVEGLSVGDEIVVGNVGLLGAGMQVQVIGTESNRARP